MAITTPNTRIKKLTAAADKIDGPLVIVGYKWISQPSSVIVANDQLVTTVGIEHFATAGHLDDAYQFLTPIRINKGESLTVSTITHGALLLFLE